MILYVFLLIWHSTIHGIQLVYAALQENKINDKEKNTVEQGVYEYSCATIHSQ